jgi:hypothetical protein
MIRAETGQKEGTGKPGLVFGGFGGERGPGYAGCVWVTDGGRVVVGGWIRAREAVT